MSAPDPAQVARNDQELAFLLDLAPMVTLHFEVTMTYLRWMAELGRPMTRTEALYFPATYAHREFLVQNLGRMRALGGCGDLAQTTEALIAALDAVDRALVAHAEGGDA